MVDFGGTPVDGSLVLCVLEQEFRIMRLRLHPKRCLQELDKLDNFRAIPDDDEDGLEVRGHYAHCGTVAKLAMRQPFVLFKGLTFKNSAYQAHFARGSP